MEKDNANPTILNTEQLPTRQKGKKGRKVAGKKLAKVDNGEALVREVMRKPEYLDSTFNDIEVPWSDPDSASDDEYTIEPIDEQEIYGKEEISQSTRVISSATLIVFFCEPLFIFLAL